MAEAPSVLDRALDEIVADRSTNNRNRRRGPGNRTPRDGVSKQSRPPRDPSRANWVHDKFDDGNNNSYRPRENRDNRDNRDHRDNREQRDAQRSSKVRVENLHYDLGESDLRDVFSRVGDIRRIEIIYDKAGRSEGVAHVIYSNPDEAMLAVDQFDGANAKGQPIRVKIASGQGGPGGRRGGGGGGGNAPNEGRSLFERVSGGPPQDGEADEAGRRGDNRRQPRNVAEMRQNAKELGIDRYIPGERNGSRDRRPPRRGGMGGGMGGERERHRGGRGGGRGGRRNDGEEKTGPINRPKKTAEELDAEMNDYWGAGGDTTVTSAFAPGGEGVVPPQQQAQNGGGFVDQVTAAAQSSAIDVDEDL